MFQFCFSAQLHGKPPAEAYVRLGLPVPEIGAASWYGGSWIGRLTANGERYRASDLTAAHRRLPFGTMVRVTNLRNSRSTVVRINNRGPFVKGRILDLSQRAAVELAMMKSGTARVRLEVLTGGVMARLKSAVLLAES